ncbi:MAG: manganese efflux pump [Defluviitaleaceae bacterium]|nr:manganese efflux pump [Defluviitaleaceae bacterium]
MIEAAILASTLSADAFTAGFAYGSKKIRIPMLSVQVINVVCCAVLGAAMFFGHLVKPFLSAGVVAWVAFGILFGMGLIKLLDDIVKALIRKYRVRALEVYADPEVADVDASACLSPVEAVWLAVSLSLDGAAVGFAVVLAGINPWVLLAWSFVANMTAILLGQRFGASIAEKLPFNISWVGGVVLIVLACARFLW